MQSGYLVQSRYPVREETELPTPLLSNERFLLARRRLGGVQRHWTGASFAAAAVVLSCALQPAMAQVGAPIGAPTGVPNGLPSGAAGYNSYGAGVVPPPMNN